MELTLDIESTIKNKGSPFTKSNRMCQLGLLKDGKEYDIYDIEYSEEPYGSKLNEVQQGINTATILIGFNIKFDLHWIRRYGITFGKVRLWDCQIAHFLITRQQARFPSLNDVAEYYELGVKEDVVAKMWEEGIDTPDIPWDILESYLKQDLNLTYQIYLKQKEYFQQNPALYRLFFLEMVDLLVLEEMEWNGMRFDKEKSLALSASTGETLTSLYSSCGFSVPISLTSGDNVSAFLFGGIFKEKYRESYEQTLKSGEVKQKERWSIRETVLPQLVKPLAKTELAKKGYYKTDKETLSQLKGSKGVKEVIKAIIEYGDVDHLNGTYYAGLPAQMDLHEEEEYIHCSFNQVVAVTGRLSSSKPNMQNRDKRIDHCFISRF